MNSANCRSTTWSAATTPDSRTSTERSSPSTMYSANSSAASGIVGSSHASLRRWATSELIDAMIRNGSRCVCTRSAFGYSASSASRHQMWPGDFSTQRVGRVVRLQVLEEHAVPRVRGRHVGLVEQPVPVRRHVVLRREDHRAEVGAGDAHALLRQARAHRVHGAEPGQHEVDHRERLVDLGDARVGVEGGGLGRRHRPVDLPRGRARGSRDRARGGRGGSWCRCGPGRR